MKKKVYSKCLLVLAVFLLAASNMLAQITGPSPVCVGSAGNVYTAPAGFSTYTWALTGGGTITSNPTPETIVVTWDTPGIWSVTVTYVDPVNGLITPLPLDVTVGPTITGPLVGGLPATLPNGITTGQVYSTESGMTNYVWAVSPAGSIVSGQGSETITVDWAGVTSQQSVSVNYTGPDGCTPSAATVMIINYYPFAAEIDPTTIPAVC